MRLEVHSEAREEFLQAVSFYEAQVPGLGLRFVTEIERCRNAVLETPLIGHPFGGGPRRESMFGIKCLRLTRVKPRVAQPHR
jgi:hypothetical protein